jgi:hypothetical protein
MRETPRSEVDLAQSLFGRFAEAFAAFDAGMSWQRAENLTDRLSPYRTAKMSQVTTRSCRGMRPQGAACHGGRRDVGTAVGRREHRDGLESCVGKSESGRRIRLRHTP